MRVILFTIISIISLSAFAQNLPTEIFGGEKVSINEFRSTVLLVANIEDNMKPFCTGVLVQRDLILTAAHCIANNRLRPITEKVTIVLGNEYIQGESKELTIKKGQFHPEFFKSEEELNDIAFIVLETPVQIDERDIPLVPQNKLETDELFVKDFTSTLVGFGLDEDRILGVKNKVETVFIKTMPSSELVIGGNGKDTCDGDSGGPVYMTTLTDGFRVVGLSSRGVDSSADGCGKGGIYTNIFHHIKWLEKESGRKLIHGQKLH